MSNLIGRRLGRLGGGGPAAFGGGIWLGLVACVAGMALIAVAWGGAASTTDVADQLPWVIAAGLPGLGVVVLGLGVLHAASRRRDAAHRADQLRELTAALAEVRSLLEDRA